MSIAHVLEDFGAYTRGRPVSLTDVSLEEQRLEAFEKGYQAGWDDSVKAAQEDTRRISADLAQNLQDLSFTYQEAYSAVLESLRPLLEQMISAVLPAMMRQSLGAQVVGQLHELARDLGPQPVAIVTAPANITALGQVLQGEQSLTVTLSEDPALSEGQVRIEFGAHEREIDLTDVLARIESSVAGFFEENRKDTA